MMHSSLMMAKFISALKHLTKTHHIEIQLDQQWVRKLGITNPTCLKFLSIVPKIVHITVSLMEPEILWSTIWLRTPPMAFLRQISHALFDILAKFEDDHSLEVLVITLSEILILQNLSIRGNRGCKTSRTNHSIRLREVFPLLLLLRYFVSLVLWGQSFQYLHSPLQGIMILWDICDIVRLESSFWSQSWRNYINFPEVIFGVLEVC